MLWLGEELPATLLQLPILILSKLQPYPAPAVFDRVFNCLPPFKVQPVTAAFRDLKQHCGIADAQFTG